MIILKIFRLYENDIPALWTTTMICLCLIDNQLEFEEPKIIVNVEQIGFLNTGADDEFQSNSMVA